MRSDARAFRIALGLTQIEASFRCRCVLSTYRQMERGEICGMRLETLVRIAAGLRCSPVDLIPELGEIPEIQPLLPAESDATGRLVPMHVRRARVRWSDFPDQRDPAPSRHPAD